MSSFEYSPKKDKANETSGIYTYNASLGRAIIVDCDTSASGNIEIPSELGGYRVYAISSGAFSGCTSITGIYVPDTVTSIEEGAFAGCSSLADISLPSLNGSGKAALFGWIFGETQYSGSASVTQRYSDTGYVTYYLPTAMKSVTVRGGSILRGAFYSCSQLTSVTLSGIKRIDTLAFYGCSGLTNLVVPDSATTIGDSAFRGCSGLVEMTIPFVG